jgi:hypothetical protein
MRKARSQDSSDPIGLTALDTSLTVEALHSFSALNSIVHGALWANSAICISGSSRYENLPKDEAQKYFVVNALIIVCVKLTIFNCGRPENC